MSQRFRGVSDERGVFQGTTDEREVVNPVDQRDHSAGHEEKAAGQRLRKSVNLVLLSFQQFNPELDQWVIMIPV